MSVIKIPSTLYPNSTLLPRCQLLGFFGARIFGYRNRTSWIFVKRFWQHCDMQAIYRKQKTGSLLYSLCFFSESSERGAVSPARPSERSRGAVSPARPSERGAVSPARPSTSSLESLERCKGIVWFGGS